MKKKSVFDKDAQTPHASFNTMAFRASTDMLSAIIVGAGLGFLVDKWLCSAHWGLIIGFILGAIAGLVNVYKSLCKIGYGFNNKDVKK